MCPVSKVCYYIYFSFLLQGAQGSWHSICPPIHLKTSLYGRLGWDQDWTKLQGWMGIWIRFPNTSIPSHWLWCTRKKTHLGPHTCFQGCKESYKRQQNVTSALKIEVSKWKLLYMFHIIFRCSHSKYTFLHAFVFKKASKYVEHNTMRYLAWKQREWKWVCHNSTFTLQFQLDFRVQF